MQTIHGGVSLAMGKNQSEYWIPTLRQIVKRRNKECHQNRRYHIKPYDEPVPGLLPKKHATQDLLFKIIGIVYAGPFICKYKTKKDIKVY